MPQIDRNKTPDEGELSVFEARNELLEKVSQAYPDLDIAQLGMCVLMLGAIRAAMGHTSAQGTLNDYIHITSRENAAPLHMKICYEFLEREVFAITKSRLDIDVYKTGNRSHVLPDYKYDRPDKEIETP